MAGSRGRFDLVLALLAATLCGVTAAGFDSRASQAQVSRQGESVPEASSDTPPVRRLHALFDEAWERSMKENPTWASSLGDRRYNDKWPDNSLNAIEQRHQQDQELLTKLASIERSELPPPEQLNYDLFRLEYENAVEGHRFRSFLMPLTHMGGIQTEDELHESLRFETVKDFDDWVSRLRALGSYVDGTIALMEQGLAEGRVPPRVTMERVPEQIKAQIVQDPEASPFFDPLESFPSEIPEADRERLRQEARRAISEVVVPAYGRFQTFFVERYLPGTRASIAARDLPEGEAYYSYRARVSTTTKLSPEEIHQIGLREVERIHKEMEKIIEQLGFEGSFEQFLIFMRTDPQFYYQDADELFDAYLAVCKRIDPELVRLFGNLPRMPYGLRPVPETSAPHTTTAYYNGPAADGSRPGYYYVNLYKPETRPKYEIEVLSVHEAVPGHHLQIALAQEMGELPRFRRFGGYTAYVEGWGLYSESLGDELGLYKDPYSKFGQLTYEMWRAVRLVVDTGMHYFGWERQRAIDFFKANAARAEHDIVNEIDRYIVWPGQALAYKIGELKIKDLRETAKGRLGERFDLRGFHDAVLGSGAVPLDVLEQIVDAHIESTLAAPSGSTVPIAP